MEKFGERIKAIREALGLTQSEMAEKLNVGKMQISRWENGLNGPNSSVLVEIANRLSVTTDYLLGLADEPKAYSQEQGLTQNEKRLLAAIRAGDMPELLQYLLQISIKEGKSAKK